MDQAISCPINFWTLIAAQITAWLWKRFPVTKNVWREKYPMSNIALTQFSCFTVYFMTHPCWLAQQRVAAEKAKERKRLEREKR